MIMKNFSLFDFIELSNWYEIYDHQKPIDYELFSYFIRDYEVYFDQIDLNTIYNTYANKKFYFKAGIDLTGYHNDFCCTVNFWIDFNYFFSMYRIPYNLYMNNSNTIILYGSIPNRIHNYYLTNSNTIFYYGKKNY